MRGPTDLTRRRSSIAATSIAWLVLGPGGSARAQSAEAEALFNDGNQLLSAGKVAQACDAFEASNRVEPRAGTLIRLGECREQNQQLASAWSAYKDALTRVKDPRKREVATARAAALEARLSYLTVSVSDESRIDGLALTRNGKPFDPMLWNRALPVDRGDYVIAGQAPGHEAWQTTAHVPVEGAKISVEVPKFKELSKLIPPPSPTIAEPPSPPSTTDKALSQPIRESPPSPGMFTTRRKIAIGVAGASLAGVVTGALLGRSARTKQDDAFKLCPTPSTPCDQADQANALIQASHSRSLQANLSFGVSAAAAIGASVLWFTGAPDAEHPRSVSVAPRAAPGEVSLVITGKF